MRQAVQRERRGISVRTTGVERGRLIVALCSAGVAAFLVASLATFDANDPPTHVVWPGNQPVRNACGPAGAWVAYHMVRLMGWGAWVVVGVAAVNGGLLLTGRRVSSMAVRVIGVAMLALAIAALQATLAPGSGAFPDLAGGLLGRWIGQELVARFGPVGSLVWILGLGGVGAAVAFDRWLVAGPARAATLVVPLMHGAGSVARRIAGAFWNRHRRRDMTGAEAIEARDTQSARRGREARVPGAEEPAPAEADESEGVALRHEATDSPAADGDSAEGEETSSPRVDAEMLRAKIARLPIIFGSHPRAVATEDDLRDLQHVEDLPGYRFPPLDLLEEPEANFSAKLEEHVRDQALALESALRQYRIAGEVTDIESGPVITLYHVRLAPGTKVAGISAVASDIARALKAVNIRIVPNMAGRDTVGIEVPNTHKEKVRLKELMANSERFATMRLPMFLGKDASGEPLIADLTQMPHMLIAGTTGSGKSVCINTIIMGFLYTRKPNELKLVLVDPKMVELSQFRDIPHLMCPVVTEMSRAAAILEWATQKMDERYELLAEAGCRDIAVYNGLPWEELRERFRPRNAEEEARIPRRLPHIVFIIDELADLMVTHREVEGSIIRIAQKARAVGIHLILATQRPQANVVTGLIKSNMPCRICFKVASGMDSRIVLDQKGGELLLGQGDMLFLSPRSSKLTRAQGTLVDDQEIRRVVRFMRQVAQPAFERQLLHLRVPGTLSEAEERVLQSANNSSASLAAAREDPLFPRAVEIVLETRRGSVSLLQRRLGIGYTRASRLIDLMGIAGIISDHKGSVARDVLITMDQWEAMKRQVETDLAALARGTSSGKLFESRGRDDADEAESDGERLFSGEASSPPRDAAPASSA